MSHFAPIFALDVETIFSVVVFVIVVLSSVISQFLNKQKQGERPQRPQRGPAPGEPMKPVAMGGNQPRKPRVEALGDEIGEFLRRAAQGGQRPAQVRSSRPRTPVPRRVQAPVEAEIIESARPPVGQGLGQKVSRDISTADIARHARDLGTETRQATVKIDKRIHESFDHRLGSLSQNPQASAEGPQTGSDDSLPITSAAGLGALLCDTESLKQAIILNEILQRPVHRW